MPDRDETPNEPLAEPPPPEPAQPAQQVWPDPSDYETRAPDADKNPNIRVPKPEQNIRTK